MTVTERINTIDSYVSRWFADLQTMIRLHPQRVPDLLPVEPETAIEMYRQYVELRNAAREALGAVVTVGGVALLFVAAAALIGVIAYFYDRVAFYGLMDELPPEEAGRAAAAAAYGTKMPWWSYVVLPVAGIGAYAIFKEALKK